MYFYEKERPDVAKTLRTIIRCMKALRKATLKATIFALLTLLTATAARAADRPIATNDLLAMERLSEPQLSPDGTRAVYTVAVPDLQANRLARNIWLVSLKTGEGLDKDTSQNF